ncbi:RNA polymerase sigma factor [Pedobacter sp. UBA4863]|uniref:RNA polymerase sigma factor n=1 Tax=Pedobacter sp. UBA4863 TaxID=1947060 RepID=UPI0025D88453|nr:RNA polymerase sigma factor [Pedobacter sp. UBA4863]
MTQLQFNEQLNDYSTSLKSFALNFTKDLEDANDLVQDTMLKAVTYYSKFKEGTNLKGWLFTIMRNTFINNYRRLVKTNTLITQSDDITYANLHYSATSNGVESKFVLKDINKALDSLAPEYHTPFLMYFEGYKYHEIAEELAIPIGTVKTRIHVARGQLKKYLKNYATDRG